MTLPLPLLHSWPLFEQHQRLDLGYLLAVGSDPMPDAGLDPQMLADQGIGLWECRLDQNALTWSTGVYDLFGLPRGATLDREETVALYTESSRAKMERLRAYAIKYRRGFTLDAEIAPSSGPRRWMRLITAPVMDGQRVVGLRGIKQDVAADYR